MKSLIGLKTIILCSRRDQYAVLYGDDGSALPMSWYLYYYLGIVAVYWTVEEGVTNSVLYSELGVYVLRLRVNRDSLEFFRSSGSVVSKIL